MERREALASACVYMMVNMILSSIFYFLAFQSFLIISKFFNYDFYSVEETIWLIIIMLVLYSSIEKGIKKYRQLRHPFCDHCGRKFEKLIERIE